MTTTEATDIEIRLLGPIEARHGDELVAIGGPRQRRLLAVLAMRANRVVSKDELIDVVFASEATSSSEHTLHTYVSRLRTALGVDGTHATVITKAPGYLLQADARCVDTVRFTSMLGDAEVAAAAGDPVRAIGLIDDALSLWQGRALAEFADEEWARAEAARLEELAQVARERRAAARLATGATAEVVPEIERLVADTPLRDGPRALLITALYRSGRQADALRAYQEYRTYLGDELGLDPSPELRALERRVLAQDPTLGAPPPQGTVLRGYQLVERIGVGAFSEVHRAVQSSVGREVAVKIIKPELADDPMFVRLFDREAQFVARLEHPHIVPLIDYWREPGGAYLVMRLMRGGSAEQRLVERGPFSLADAAILVDEVGEALAVAHALGVVHRDVKPANILYDENGHTYLGDFGIALEDARRSPDDKALRAAGSPLYAAPEQLRDGLATAASDQYAFAVLIWELLTGRAAFDVDSLSALLRLKAAGPIGSLQPWRPDLAAAVDHVLRTATTPDPDRRFADMGELVLAFRAAAGTSKVATTTGGSGLAEERPRARASRTLVSMRLEQQNPYKGLRAFDEADSAEFFGRTRLVGELVEKMTSSRFVAVVGPSGVGKSSVVRAGLVPAIRDGARPGSERWFIATMTPGRDPFAELEVGLLRVATSAAPGLRAMLVEGPSGLAHSVRAVLPGDDSDVLLVIDQFEELFTLCTDEERRTAFLAALIDALTDPQSRLRVVLTLRADAYDRPLQYRAFGELVEAGHVTVMTPSSDELADAITRPAEHVGVRVDGGLLAQLVADVADRPAALPLMQYALTELYDRRVNGVMTLDAYREIGGVSGALANRADAVYEGLPAGPHDVARHIFTSLLVVDAATVAPRRRVPVADITATSEDWISCERAIELFAEQRLLSFDRDPATRNPTIEIAHEALLTCWPRLAQWIDDDREDLRMVQVLTVAATEWDHAGRDEADLFRGPRLLAAAGWAEQHPARLTPLHRDFLQTAQTRDDRELRSARRTSKRLRRLAVGLGAALAASVATVGIAVTQRNEARDQRAAAQAAQLEARRQADLVSAGDFLFRSATVGVSNPALAVALAAESVAATDTPLARATVALLEAREALKAVPGLLVRTARDHEFGRVLEVAFSPDGTLLALVGDQGTVLLADAATGAAVGGPLSGHVGPVGTVTFSPDSHLLATGGDDGTTRLWDPVTGSAIGLPLVGAPSDAAFSPDGRLLATVVGGGLRLWDTATGQPVRDLPGVGAQGSIALAYSPDGTQVAAGVGDIVWRWDLTTGRVMGALPAADLGGAFDMEYSSDGTRLAAAFAKGAVVLWDAVTGEVVNSTSTAHQGPATGVAFSPDGTRLASSGTDLTVRLWDGVSGLAVDGEIALAGAAYDVAFSPDGTRVATAENDSIVELFDVSTSRGRPFAEPLVGHTGYALAVALTRDGTRLASGGSDGTVRLWDPATAQAVGSPLEASKGTITTVDFSPDGTLVAAGGSDRTVTLWDPTTGLRIGGPLTGHTAGVLAVDFSPDGRVLASGGLDTTVRLWDPATGEALDEPLDGHLTAVTAVVFSPDGTRLVSGDYDGTVVWWNPATGEVVDTSRLGDAAVEALAFSPDGSMLAALLDGEILILDTHTHGVVKTMCCHADTVFSISFSADGRLLAAPSADRTVRLWDPTTGNFLGELSTGAVNTPVVEVAMDAVGRWLAAATAGGSVRVWDLKDTAAACAAAAPYVTAAQLQEQLPEGRTPKVCHFQ